MVRSNTPTAILSLIITREIGNSEIQKSCDNYGNRERDEMSLKKKGKWRKRERKGEERERRMEDRMGRGSEIEEIDGNSYEGVRMYVNNKKEMQVFTFSLSAFMVPTPSVRNVFS